VTPSVTRDTHPASLLADPAVLAGPDALAEDAALAEDETLPEAAGVLEALLGADEAVGAGAVGFRASSSTRTWLASVAP
jgi:hypothetical protein